MTPHPSGGSAEPRGRPDGQWLARDLRAAVRISGPRAAPALTPLPTVLCLAPGPVSGGFCFGDSEGTSTRTTGALLEDARLRIG